MESSIFNYHEHSVNSFLKHVLDGLDKAKISYCVERNYQDYPNSITGDLDVLVSSEDLNAAVLETYHVAEEQNWKPYISHKTSQSAHIGFYTDLYPQRFVLVVEFFVGGSWRGFSFLDAKRVLKYRQKHGHYWKPQPCHEAMITLIHHLLYNKKVYDKYKDSIYNLYVSDSSMFKKELALVYGARVANLVSENIAIRNWSGLELISADLRKVLVFRSFIFSFRKTLYDLIILYFKIRSKPNGLLIIVQDEDNILLDLSEAIIDLAARWHIFIPPNKIILRWDKSLEINMVKVVKKVISSGGIAIVTCNSFRDLQSSKRGAKYMKPGVLLFGATRGVNLVIESKCHEIEFNTPKSMANSFWNIVLQNYASKS